MDDEQARAALAWQAGVWDRMSDVYQAEIDRRFVPVVEGVVARANLTADASVLDLGTGTGAAALQAAVAVGPAGHVLAVDPSPEMLDRAGRRAAAAGLSTIDVRQGHAESIPAPDAAFDAVLASLSLMFAVDRGAAGREIARVLRPGRRLVAAVWSGPESCDLVRFQQIAGRFAPAPPVPGVGPGALGDPTPFIAQLAEARLTAAVERDEVDFDFPDFASAWRVFANVTAAALGPEDHAAAQAAAKAAMWPNGDGPRTFRNTAIFIVADRAG